MADSDDGTDLAGIPPARRILLLSHCLRPSRECPGKFSKRGLECPPDCQVECVVGRLRRTAERLGYFGVCVAAGGAMALRAVKESRAAGIVAVACTKELREGVQGVAEWVSQSQGTAEVMAAPTIVGIELIKDGCVDTEVVEEDVLQALQRGLESCDVS